MWVVLPMSGCKLDAGAPGHQTSLQLLFGVGREREREGEGEGGKEMVGRDREGERGRERGRRACIMITSQCFGKHGGFCPGPPAFLHHKIEKSPYWFWCKLIWVIISLKFLRDLVACGYVQCSH
jgi:hypothetical protein